MSLTQQELERYTPAKTTEDGAIVHVRLNPMRLLRRIPLLRNGISAAFKSDSLRYAVSLAVLCAGYVFVAWIDFSFPALNRVAPLVWFPNGLAIAALYLYGYRLWPAVALGSLFGRLLYGFPPTAAGVIALGNVAENVFAVWALHQILQFDPLFARLRDSLGFIAVSLSVTVISPTVAVLTLYAYGIVASGTLMGTWLAWWMGDALGVLVLAPFIIRWFLRPDFHRPRKYLIESIFVLLALSVVSLIVFWSPAAASVGPFSPVYLLFIPLGWGALRAGPRAMTLGILLVSAIATSAVAAHLNIYSMHIVEQELISLQLFMAFVVMLFLPLTSIVEDRKNVTLTLREKNRQLGALLERLTSDDQAKNEFIAILAHELRNPLSPVVSSLELMKMQMEQSDHASQHSEQLALLQTAGTHLSTITTLLDDLLDISRMTRKKLKLHIEHVELQPIIQHAAETIRNFFASRNISLSISVPQEPIYINADSVRLEQVFINVLHNAAKYTNPGGHADLYVVTDPVRGVRIAIKDNGIGMTRGVMEKIFEPFMQAHEKHGVGTGVGIGLYLTQRLVEMHGGRIWAESEGPGKGSEFIIVLPPQQPSEPAAETAAPLPVASDRKPFMPPSEDSSPKHTILVVDDNEAAAASLGKLLQLKGHTVVVCHNAIEALRCVEDTPVDVALLDIGLPGMDGYTLARAMRDVYAGKPLLLIALTGYGQEEDKQRARDAGFDHHLTKPVGISDVEELLEE